MTDFKLSEALLLAQAEGAQLLSSLQRESAWVNDCNGVLAFMGGVLLEIQNAKTHEDARTYAELALNYLAEFTHGFWKPEPIDDPADWKQRG